MAVPGYPAMMRLANTIALGALLLLPLRAGAQVTLSEYAGRRAAAQAELPRGAMLVLGAPEPLRDYDVFTPSENLRYLTGWDAPDAALLLPTSGPPTLFVAERNAAQEVWSGVRLSLADAATRVGLATRSILELRTALDSVLEAGDTLTIVGEFRDATSAIGSGSPRDRVLFDELKAKHPLAVIRDGNRILLSLRAKKSEAEIALLRRAIDITSLAHRTLGAQLAPGWNEFEAQALIEYTFRRNGAERPGFASIVGSGDNATTLHYNRNDRVMQAGDLVVVDIGASYQGYSADVTRTYPVSGQFTPPQRAIYDIVRRAQQAAEDAVRVGRPQPEASARAAEVISEGLAAVGLIESPTATYECSSRATRVQTCAQWRLYYMHGLGHGIGLSVHDPDRSDRGTWEAGSVITIEPGIYVRRSLPEVLPPTPRNQAFLKAIAGALKTYGGIGVRIEDDFLVTPTGLERLSQVPREAADVEQLRRAAGAARVARQPALVDGYRRSLP